MQPTIEQARQRYNTSTGNFDVRVFKELQAMSDAGMVKGEMVAVHNSAKQKLDEWKESGMSVSDAAEMLLNLDLIRYE